jgi:lambda repressor-like predicted transcriptional regulator
VRRYPIANLLEATGLSLSALAQRVGIGGGEYARVRTEGVSELAADRWANRLGLHPAEVWPDFGFAVCAADGCQERFAPVRKGHVYCSKRCNNRAIQRERYRLKYATDPGFVEAERQRRRRYYEQCAGYERSRQARYRAARRAA